MKSRMELHTNTPPSGSSSSSLGGSPMGVKTPEVTTLGATPQTGSEAGLEVGSKSLPTEITILLPTNAYFMSGIRDFTLSMIRNMTDFSEQWAFRFQSVVDELCNNAIEHGSSPDDQIKIVFRNFKDTAIEIIVHDHGTGPQHVSAEEVKAKIAKNKNTDITQLGIRGRGLSMIVSEWTDELEITDNSDGGISVRVRKYLHDNKFTETLPDADPTHIVL